MKNKNGSRFVIGISQFFQFPFNIYLVKLLPFFLIRIYIYFLGFIYFTIANQQTVKIDRCVNYILRPSSKGLFQHFLYLKAYGGIFEHYYEKLLMAYKPLKKMFQYLGQRLRPKLHKDFLSLIQKGQGCILVTGHFGAVEFLPIAMNIQKIKIAMICRFNSKKLRETLLEKAALHDVMLIDADCSQVIYKAMEAIKDGRVLITECDEFSQWRPHKRLKISVFGHKYPADRTLDFFYKKAKVPAFLGLMQRDNGNFILRVEPIATGNPETSIAKNAWVKLEQCILKHPFQWYQWKSAYSLLESNIRSSYVENKGTVLGSIKTTVHSSH